MCWTFVSVCETIKLSLFAKYPTYQYLRYNEIQPLRIYAMTSAPWWIVGTVLAKNKQHFNMWERVEGSNVAKFGSCHGTTQSKSFNAHCYSNNPYSRYDVSNRNSISQNLHYDVSSMGGWVNGFVQ